MSEMIQQAALEATHGPYRVQIDGADIRGYWADEDARDAADAFARKGRPASVNRIGRSKWPNIESIRRDQCQN